MRLHDLRKLRDVGPKARVEFLGVLPTASLPPVLSRSIRSGALSASAVSRWIVSTISRGVFAGTNRPCQLEELEAGHGFGDSRHVRQRRRALRAADRQRLEQVVLQVRQRGRHRHHADLDFAAISAALSGASPR